MPLITCADCGKQISDAAPACIHCGRPLMQVPKSEIAPSSLGDRVPGPRCPRCGSHDLRSLSVVYASGMSTTRGSGGLAGVGIDEDGGLAFAGGRLASSGVQQTELAKAAAPPEPQTVSWLAPGFVGGVTSLLVVLLGGWRLGGIEATVLALTVGFIVAKFVHRRHHRAAQDYNENVYRPNKALWDQSIMCLRCGNIAQRADLQAAV
jgi:DNA-directed RNA polymerase subunit RPC12/RpoP